MCTKWQMRVCFRLNLYILLKLVLICHLYAHLADALKVSILERLWRVNEHKIGWHDCLAVKYLCGGYTVYRVCAICSKFQSNRM